MPHDPAHADTASISRSGRRGGAWIALLLGLAALVLALAAAPAQARVPKEFFGITEGGAVTAPDYEQMHKIKVRTFRVSVNWNTTEPRRDAFNWSRIDNQLTRLARSGIKPAFVVWGAPEWATGSDNPAVPPLKSKAKRAWKSFLKEVVKRYKKGGEFWRTHPNVPEKPAKTWQIWNEPNLPKYFAKKGRGAPKSVPHTGKAYAKLVKSAHKAIHKADRRAKVILAGLTGNPRKKKQEPTKFIKKFLKVNKAKRSFDAAALHPYAAKIKKYKSRIRKFRKALNKNGAKKKEIWLTEVGWGSKKNRQRLNKGLAGQARMLKKSFKTTLSHRKKWKIDRLYWFTWRDQASGGGCSFCRSAGLLRFNMKKKPAYRKFKHFTKMQGKGGHRRHQHRG